MLENIHKFARTNGKLVYTQVQTSKPFQEMKYLIITISSLLFVLLTYAQNLLPEPCNFDDYIRQNRQSVEDIEKNIQKYLNQHAYFFAKSGNVKIIPVVVHVIHNGGSENISDAQVQSQIDGINEDYRKISGTAGDGNGADTEIEFCLAKITPNGKCTNGIVRIQSTLTNHQNYQRADLAKLSSWDATAYLNMYVVKTISGGTIGYASFPGGPADQDGIVVEHSYFGRTGTASATLGRTTTHELGHWFGLYHTFNNGCGADTCSDGDYVCDTPPVVNPNYGCSAINSCSNDFPDVADQIENYLDYTDDNCKNMFTAGQKARMQSTLNTERFVIWQNSNLVSTGCDSGYVTILCSAVADFTSNAQNICVGNPVLFTNKSLNNCTSYQWYFPGGTPSSSTALNPTIIFNAVGNYDVTLIATNANGSDSITFSSYITVSNPIIGQAAPFWEEFETSSFPPNGIVIENPDNGITWEWDTVAIKYSGFGSAKINNLINTNYGQADALVFPNFDLTTFSATPRMTFRWAYAKSDVNYSDELLVLISKDCGVNFTQIFYKTGTAMTTGTTQTTPYIPDSATVWKLANINLANYATSTNVIIKIVNVTDGGNNLYIDSINIGTYPTDINDIDVNYYDVSIFPNPAKSLTTIQYILTESKNVSIDIYNTPGKRVYFMEESNQMEGTHQISIDTEKLRTSSFLLVNIKIGNKTISKKIFYPVR